MQRAENYTDSIKKVYKIGVLYKLRRNPFHSIGGGGNSRGQAGRVSLTNTPAKQKETFLVIGVVFGGDNNVGSTFWGHSVKKQKLTLFAVASTKRSVFFCCLVSIQRVLFGVLLKVSTLLDIFGLAWY